MEGRKKKQQDDHFGGFHQVKINKYLDFVGSSLF
jgi:hypothetical protein